MRSGSILRTMFFSALSVLLLSLSTPVLAQLTLEIPETEFEEAENYKPIPVPDPSGGPVNQIFESMELDMTGTLPEAVLEEMLGETPYDFVDVVWGMEVTGDWTDRMTGEGTLQVTDFTEGRGASAQPDPERFTGQRGFRMYNARLQTDGDHVFTLSAAFPPEHGGVAFGTELEDVKGVFEVTWLCHMFEPGRRGCIDYPDEYYETELPVLSKLHIQRRAGGYKIDFAARVFETRTHNDRSYQLTEPTGRFADVRGWVCDRTSWEEDPEACAAPEPLQVTMNSPPHQRENVHLKTPQIEVEFNFPVDADDLEENFSLTTRNNSGDPLEMTGRIMALSDTLFEFKLDDLLESGVIYEARIQGGKDGVRGRDGEVLRSDAHWWRFTTLVDLENHGGPVEEPVRTHVYQTVRDAPLVVDKPALQRIYVEWQAHDHIHTGWQPESYPAELEISVIDQSQWRVDPQFGGSVEGDVVRVVRSDLPEGKEARREVERHAGNTINVYGWTPDQQGGTSVIETRLTPHDPYPSRTAAQDVIAQNEVQHWHTDPAPLVFRYTFLQVGSWEDGVPEAEMQAAMSVVRMAEEFAVQVMPVREAFGNDTGRDADGDYASRYRDSFTAALDTIVKAAEAAGLDVELPEDPEIDPTQLAQMRVIANLEAVENTIRAVREDIGSFFSANDILVVFYPPDFYAPGRTFHQASQTDGLYGVGMPITLDRSPSELAEGLVHEFGHYFGLLHRPGEASEIAFTDALPVDEIEGFRLSIDGMSGHNKSSTEGNGEHPVTMAPLMFPYLLDLRMVWLNNDEYMMLMRTFSTRIP
ncbi:Ig-like domain-containing protein [Loktanella sp. SALINAS62]|uniref:Ig-like domain-containing protein n=1 Tax=Loktanella sp. SALINAS62 TaxID=2706124 RepID=UPI001B8BB62C|nr:Ig-like domain-containing protein [Loktanella sp. SALINAS62]MBS1302681.1 Ig-like domain-containing protein [Loktanella sp. SALINAS62]